MSKKQRRTRAQSTAGRGPSAPNRAPSPTATVAEPVRISRSIRPPTEARVKEVDWNKEYHYVVEDLRRIAIYAAGLFALLIVVAIIFAVAA